MPVIPPPATSTGRRARLLAVAAIGGSYLAVRSGASEQLDRRAARALAFPLGRRVDVLVSAGTDLGSVYGLAGLSGTLALSGRPRMAVDVALAGLTGWGAAQATKPLIGRDRPYVVHGADRLVAVPAGSSWPSGHVAVAAAMGAAITPHVAPRARPWVQLGVAGVAASRCYVGVHHLTDVVAGWGVGVLAEAGIRTLRRVALRRWRASRSQRGGTATPGEGAAVPVQDAASVS